MKNWIFAALLSVGAVASSTNSLAQIRSYVGPVMEGGVSSLWNGIYVPGDPACQTTPDGFVFNLLGIVPNGGGGPNPSFNFFLPRTHRDYDAIVAMIIAAKVAGTSVYVIPESTFVCGMPVVATLVLV